jgi:hypothetical protein
MNCLVLIIICTKDLSTQNAQVETDYHYNFNIWNEHIYSKGDNNRFTISTWMLLSELSQQQHYLCIFWQKNNNIFCSNYLCKMCWIPLISLIKKSLKESVKVKYSAEQLSTFQKKNWMQTQYHETTYVMTICLPGEQILACYIDFILR